MTEVTHRHHGRPLRCPPFGNGAIAARNLAQLDDAAKHFANGVAILWVQAVVAVLLQRAPQTFRGRPLSVGPPPANAGFVLRPGLRSTRAMGPGEGATSSWGEITIFRLGSATDRRLVALHEAVHRALTPRLDVLRFTRIEGRAGMLTTYLRALLSPKPKPRLTRDEVHALVQSFVSQWPPFHARFATYGSMRIDWMKDPQGRQKWIATLTPAKDIRCGVVVADDLAQVTEARMTATRTRSILAQWPQA